MNQPSPAPPAAPSPSSATAPPDPPTAGREPDDVTFRTRKWIRPEDLNSNGTLFGGSLLRWIDEEAAIHAIFQLGSARVVTKYISEINFVSSARQGDIVEIGLRATTFGRTSVTMRARVRNMITRRDILTIERLVFVNVGEDGRPVPHGYTELTHARDRMSAGPQVRPAG